jgi:hypothetical protein
MGIRRPLAFVRCGSAASGISRRSHPGGNTSFLTRLTPLPVSRMASRGRITTAVTPREIHSLKFGDLDGVTDPMTSSKYGS